MQGYTEFARFYDRLMTGVSYSAQADILLGLLEGYGRKPALVLDLACGTGSLSIELAQRGLEVIGVDGSSDMLMVAQEKAREAEVEVLFLCQQMEMLDLYGTVDTVFCTLDSLNHLTDEAQLKTVFERVALFLEPGGYFLFDVNTMYKHEQVLADNTFVYETPEVYCVWQNKQGKNGLTEIRLDFFERTTGGYTRATEHFAERAYPFERIREMLAQAGLRLEGVYNESGGTKLAPDARRILCAARNDKAELLGRTKYI